MKNVIQNIKFIAIAMLTLSLSSCDAVLDDDLTDFGDTPVLVQFESTEITANFIQSEENPVYTYDIPVTLIGGRNEPIDRPVNVTVSIDESSTATEGVEYNLVNNDITIPAGEMTADVQIEVLSENLDAFDPKTLVLEIESASETISDTSHTDVVLQAACELDMSSFVGTYQAEQGGLLGEGNFNVEITEGPESNTLLITGLNGDSSSETIIELNEDPTDPTITYRSEEFNAVLFVDGTYGDAWATTIEPAASSYGSCDNSMSLEFSVCVGAGCFGGTVTVELTKQ